MNVFDRIVACATAWPRPGACAENGPVAKRCDPEADIDAGIDVEPDDFASTCFDLDLDLPTEGARLPHGV